LKKNALAKSKSCCAELEKLQNVCFFNTPHLPKNSAQNSKIFLKRILNIYNIKFEKTFFSDLNIPNTLAAQEQWRTYAIHGTRSSPPLTVKTEHLYSLMGAMYGLCQRCDAKNWLFQTLKS